MEILHFCENKQILSDRCISVVVGHWSGKPTGRSSKLSGGAECFQNIVGNGEEGGDYNGCYIRGMLRRERMKSNPLFFQIHSVTKFWYVQLLVIDFTTAVCSNFFLVILQLMVADATSLTSKYWKLTDWRLTTSVSCLQVMVVKSTTDRCTEAALHLSVVSNWQLLKVQLEYSW